MKKTVLALFSVLLLLSVGLQSCSKTKTYAEKLSAEKKAIDRYIRANDIKVISYDEFIANNEVTNLDKNEYVELQTGLYLQIVDKGSENPADTFKTNSEITVRFEEYDIMNKWYTNVSNTNQPLFVDAFVYNNANNSLSGKFVGNGHMRSAYGDNVPTGWLIPLKYLRADSKVKLIISSKLGHAVSAQEVYPYFYNIKPFGVSKH